jgi:hypothetical protein
MIAAGKPRVPLLAGHPACHNRIANDMNRRPDFNKSTAQMMDMLRKENQADVPGIQSAIDGRADFAMSVHVMGAEEAAAMAPYNRNIITLVTALNERIPASASGVQRADALEAVLDEIDKLEIWRRSQSVPWDTEGGTLDRVRWTCVPCANQAGCVEN